MVLESLIPIKTAEKKPIEMVPLAFLYATIAMFIGLWIFPNHASLTLVFFTVMACLPLMLQIIRFEEKVVLSKRLQKDDPHHKRALPFFVFLFLGMVLAFSLWFVLLPQSLVQNMFSVQINTITQINNQVSGAIIFPAKYFFAVLFNNIRVLIFVLLFSFIYGAGAIFILTWNASVIAVAIGNTIRSGVAAYAGAAGVAGAYFTSFSLGLMRYMIHGIPEIGAYFVGGLAGGMISVAIIKHEFWDNNFKKVVKDSMHLVVFAVGLLLLAGLLETFVSPLVPI